MHKQQTKGPPLSPPHILCPVAPLYAPRIDRTFESFQNIRRERLNGSVVKNAKRKGCGTVSLSPVNPLPMIMASTFSAESHVVGKFTG